MLTRTLHWLIVAVAGLFFALFLFLPLLTIFRGMFGGQAGNPLKLLSLLFTSPNFYRRLFNSLNLALCTTALATAIAFPLACLTARYRFPGRSFFQTALLLPMILP